jgi:hypothetical protein
MGRGCGSPPPILLPGSQLSAVAVPLPLPGLGNLEWEGKGEEGDW